MSGASKIDKTDSTWNAVRARLTEAGEAELRRLGALNAITGKTGWHCVHVSEGCRNCYAEAMNRWRGTGFAYAPEASRRGWIELFLDEAVLAAPLRWRKARRVFVCSMTDLFADFVPVEWNDRIFAVMALTPRHSYQVLTKRPERMREYIRSRGLGDGLEDGLYPIYEAMKKLVGDKWEAMPSFPPPNMIGMVSVEDQASADARIPVLLDTPLARRGISLEPMLGPVDLLHVKWPKPLFQGHTVDVLRAGTWDMGHGFTNHSGLPRLDWVICGGESGPSARPLHPDWVRRVRDQCVAAGVPFFFKQWGEWESSEYGTHAIAPDGRFGALGDEGELPRGHWPFGTHIVERIGKRASGRVLDECIWDQMPAAG